MIKPTLKWLQMKAVYEQFKPQDCPNLTYTEQDAIDMFLHESTGTSISQTNGYYWCKRNLDITLAMWEEDIIKGELIKFELLQDKRFPRSWLSSWLDTIVINSNENLDIVLESKLIPDYKVEYQILDIAN